MGNLKIWCVFTIIFLSSMAIINAETFGYCNPELPNIEGCEAINDLQTAINYSIINVNDSTYWQGHTGTDGTWLTGLVPYINAITDVNLGLNNLLVYANDDGLGTSGMFLADMTFLRGSWFSPSGLDGVAFDANGNVTTLDRALYMQGYSSGDLDLCYGGGDIQANDADFYTTGTGNFNHMIVGDTTITNTLGSISFNDENLATTGNINASNIITNGFTIGNNINGSGNMSMGYLRVGTTNTDTSTNTSVIKFNNPTDAFVILNSSGSRLYTFDNSGKATYKQGTALYDVRVTNARTIFQCAGDQMYILNEAGSKFLALLDDDSHLFYTQNSVRTITNATGFFVNGTIKTNTNFSVNNVEGITTNLNLTSANGTNCYQNFTGGILTFTNCLTY